MEFQSEADYLRTASHPAVPQLYDVGRLPEERGFLAIEWVDGQSLEAHVTDAPILLGDALAVAAVLADVLNLLHRQGILHRDVKPLNVLIPSISTMPFANVKIVDFGIARRLSEHDESGQPSTDFGRQVGTPAYMAPEQLAGRRQTTATDVFGLGATLFFMLFRRPPMDEDNVARGHVSLPGSPRFLCGTSIARRLMEEIELPEEPIYPFAVRDLLTLMLKRVPSARLQSAIEVRDRLHTLRETLAQPAIGL
jgi:serine/threonine protein kinase